MTDEQKAPYLQTSEEGFINGRLFPYQKIGARWLSSRKVALLADEQRLGKSIQCIAAANMAKCVRILIICPSIGRHHWLCEFDRFSSFKRNFFLVSTSKDEIPASHSTIISYDLLNEIPKNILGLFDLVIIDEVHRAKNTEAKRTHSVFGKKGIVHEQKPSTKIWALSGTPAPNHAGELWPILCTFGATSLNYDDFIQRFCVLAKKTFGNKVQTTITGTKKSAVPELRRLLAKIMLRRTQIEVGSQLPPVRFSTIYVEEGEVDLEITPDFVKYVFPKNRVDVLEAELKEQISLIQKAIKTKDLEILKGLAKSCTTLRRYMGIQKVEKTAELLKQELESNPDHKIVIFAIHKDVVEGMHVRLKEFNPVTLYGGTRFDSANKNIEKFKTNPRCRVFIGNIIAAGMVIDLSISHDIIFIEQDWVPGNNAQAAARCNGPNQKNPVSVRFMSIANSLDEKIVNIIKKKTEELTSIFDGAKSVETFDELIS